MRIVFDLQSAQFESRSSSNGRTTSLALAQAIVRNCGEHEVIVALSGFFPGSIESIRAEFDGLLPQENIRVWYAPGPIGEAEPAHKLRRDAAELIREGFLADLRPDVIVLSDVLLGWKDEGVGSVDRFLTGVNTAAIVLGGIVECGSSEEERRWYLRQQEFARKVGRFFVSDERAVRAFLGTTSADCRIMEIAPTQRADGALDAAACQILSELTTWLAPTAERPSKVVELAANRPRLAYVSPLPAERSGIADYSAELLPFLSRYYEVDVVVAQSEVADPWVQANCRIMSAAEFLQRHNQYDRVIYHFGNNPMHTHMFEMLAKAPGVVVLHDFFLSGVQWYREAHGFVQHALLKELYQFHGYKAVRERFKEGDEKTVFKYPCNFSALQKAVGVIVHSENSLRLAQQWYGCAADFSVIPLLRLPATDANRKKARAKLGLSNKDFVVCSFGFIGKTKQNQRLLDAWEASPLLNSDKSCKLFFVGENDDSHYGREIARKIKTSRKLSRVTITGWTDAETYQLYLEAADVGVQLRTLSRGETSAAVLDCMNYGLATVVNANGAMADLPDDAVWKLPDEFADAQLVTALETLRAQPAKEKVLSERAAACIHERHAPEVCAVAYAESIEKFYANNRLGHKALISALAQTLPQYVDDQYVIELASALSLNAVQKRSARRLFVDVSVVVRDDFKTGIQRVVRALTLALIESPPEGFLIEPVYLTEDGGTWHYRYARDYTFGLLECAQGWLSNERIEPCCGDMFLGLDLAGGYVIQADRAGVYAQLRARGVNVAFVVYDLIPIQFESIYPPGFKEGHAEWLGVVSKADSAICISKAVAGEMAEWVAAHGAKRAKPLNIEWFHLGADLGTTAPSSGLPENAAEVFARLSRAPTFLMVGTVEPRKGHAQVIKAFELLWANNVNVNLVVVGKKGWMVDTLTDSLQAMREKEQRFFWLEGASDEYLESVYKASSCLIAASEGEGFGLPLIEAAQHKLPIIARDLPVFREVAGAHAFYFHGLAAEALAGSINEWLDLYENGRHPTSERMPWLTWQESAEQLKSVMLNQWHQTQRSAVAAN